MERLNKLLNDKIKEDLPQLKKITLEVKASNTKALNFYYKNGFTKIDVRKKYYKDGEDALVLMKEYV